MDSVCGGGECELSSWRASAMESMAEGSGKDLG
jgi:hypothetical protein